MKQGQRGLCFIRQNLGGEVVMTSYGRSSGFCIDPIEKKPLNHFLPGTPVLSLGTAGCNLSCNFCQNWDISKARAMDNIQDLASPEAIADAAVRTGCKSVAFTYNDPVIFHEYAIDIAQACHEREDHKEKMQQRHEEAKERQGNHKERVEEHKEKHEEHREKAKAHHDKVKEHRAKLKDKRETIGQ